MSKNLICKLKVGLINQKSIRKSQYPLSSAPVFKNSMQDAVFTEPQDGLGSKGS